MLPSELVRGRGNQASGASTAARFALLQKGFRPFFFGAAAHAALAVPLWAAMFAGFDAGTPFFASWYWHAHEMLFGFTLAVIAGFLLTAASNWTGRETVTPRLLLGLFALWTAARVLMFVPPSWAAGAILVTLIDLGFAPALAVLVALPILKTDNRRNLVFIVILGGLTLANLLMHLGRAGLLQTGLAMGTTLGLDLVLLVIVIMTGRVIPMFTRNATGLDELRASPRWERASFAAVALVVLADLLPLPTWFQGSIAALCGFCVLYRARHWGFGPALRHPLLWVLHLGHLWTGLALLLKSASLWGLWWGATWKHALTAGGIGMLTVGMMVRVTLGHTGRMLVAPASAVISFVAIALAAFVRVVGPLALPQYSSTVLGISATLWALAFLAYLVACGRMLLTPRVDGRAG